MEFEWLLVIGSGIFLLLVAVGGNLLKQTQVRRIAGLDYFGGERFEYEDDTDDGGGRDRS